MLALLVAKAVVSQPVGVVFRNEMDEDVEVFWMHPGSGEKSSVGTIGGFGGELRQETHAGHVFSSVSGALLKHGQDRCLRGTHLRADRETSCSRMF